MGEDICDMACETREHSNCLQRMFRCAHTLLLKIGHFDNGSVRKCISERSQCQLINGFLHKDSYVRFTSGYPSAADSPTFDNQLS